MDFIPCKSSHTAINFAHEFFPNIFNQHGMPDNSASGRVTIITSNFRDRIIFLCGAKLNISSSNNPKTDVESEVMNRMVQNYLRCYISYRHDDWDDLLPSV